MWRAGLLAKELLLSRLRELLILRLCLNTVLLFGFNTSAIVLNLEVSCGFKAVETSKKPLPTYSQRLDDATTHRFTVHPPVGFSQLFIGVREQPGC